MSVPAPRGQSATPDELRAHRAELLRLAAQYGLVELRVTEAGRLVALAEEGRSYFDVVRFEQAASAVLGAAVTVEAQTRKYRAVHAGLAPL